MKQFLELSDIPRILDARIKEAGGIEQFSSDHGIQEAFIHYALSGLLSETDQLDALGMLPALNLKKVTVYERIKG